MKFKLNKYIIDDIENYEHPSDYETSNGYKILILRLPYIKNNEIEIVSYAFLIDKSEVYIFDRGKKDFIKLGTFYDLYAYLDVRIDKILAKISKFHTQIAKMEDDLYDNEFESDFANRWLMLKKHLALIERLMAHAMIAFERFLKHNKEYIDEYAFQDIAEHMERSFRFSKAALDKLDYLYNFYRAKMDEKTNYVVFILTLLSGIFLPLTLLTGFFGMNTGGLPFVNDPDGTIKVILIGTFFEIPFILWLWYIMKRN